MNFSTSFSSIPHPIENKRRKRAETRIIQGLQAEYSSLLSLAETVKNDISAAETNFEMVSEPKAVDIYIYRIRAAQTRYANILNQLQTIGYKIEHPDEILIEDTHADI